MVFSFMDSQPFRLVISLISLGTIISFNNQESFERIIPLGLHKFSGAIGENDYEILINCQQKLHNLRIFESYSVSYTTDELTDVVKDWWMLYLSDRNLGLSHMTEHIFLGFREEVYAIHFKGPVARLFISFQRWFSLLLFSMRHIFTHYLGI